MNEVKFTGSMKKINALLCKGVAIEGQVRQFTDDLGTVFQFSVSLPNGRRATALVGVQNDRYYRNGPHNRGVFNH